MCSGPFKPVAYVKGARTTLDAVPNYWDTAQQPKIKSITFTTVNDAEALIAGLRSGSINGTFDLPARDALSLSGDSSLKVNYVPYGGDVNYLSPNVEKGPFKNPLVREAFNLAIPRSALATAVDGKYGRPLDLVETPALFTDHQSQYMAAYNALGSPEQPEPDQGKAAHRQGRRQGRDGEHRDRAVAHIRHGRSGAPAGRQLDRAEREDGQAHAGRLRQRELQRQVPA